MIKTSLIEGALSKCFLILTWSKIWNRQPGFTTERRLNPTLSAFFYGALRVNECTYNWDPILCDNYFIKHNLERYVDTIRVTLHRYKQSQLISNQYDKKTWPATLANILLFNHSELNNRHITIVDCNALHIYCA